MVGIFKPDLVVRVTRPIQRRDYVVDVGTTGFVVRQRPRTRSILVDFGMGRRTIVERPRRFLKLVGKRRKR